MHVDKAIGCSVAAASIPLLQFLTFPYFADIDVAGKLFVFTFSVLIWSLVFFRKISCLQFPPFMVLFLALISIFFLSALQAFNPEWAFLQVGIFSVFCLFCLMLVNRIAEWPSFAEKLINSLLLFGVLAAILGLYEYVHHLLLGPTKGMLIPFLLPPDSGLPVVGVYAQPNLFAVFLTLVLLAFFYKYLHPQTQDPRLQPFAALRFLPFVLVGLILFLTGSRAGMLSISLILGMLSWLVASGRYLLERSRRNEFMRLLLFLACAFLIGKGLNLLFAPGLSFGRALGDTGISTDGRFVFWASAVLIFLDHPWLGIGLDGYKFLQNGYGPLSRDILGFVPYEAMGNTNWTHNELLQILCEGGVFAFLLTVGMLFYFLYRVWAAFIRRSGEKPPLFLYSHVFLFPFIIQSFFEWPFRHPPLLALFFSCLAVLLSQYPMISLPVSPGGRKFFVFAFVAAFALTAVLLVQEISFGKFLRALQENENVESTLPQFRQFSQNPYTGHRVMKKVLPIYARAALAKNDLAFTNEIIPFQEQLCRMEGVRWDWYNLSLLYLKVQREEEARHAIQKAIGLMPPEDRYWDILHYLNVLKAARVTGRPVESFFPSEIKMSARELLHDRTR